MVAVQCIFVLASMTPSARARRSSPLPKIDRDVGLLSSEVTDAFAVADHDGNGKLDAHEIESILKKVDAHASYDWKKFDSDADGYLTLKEFQFAAIAEKAALSKQKPSALVSVGTEHLGTKQDTSMEKSSVLDLAADREDEEKGNGMGKEKQKVPEALGEAAENTLVAGLLTYKLLHSDKCPDVFTVGSSNSVEGSATYGIGCGHPMVNCWCPMWLIEGCVDNTFPIAKFGQCKIAWWTWVLGVLLILSFGGCAFMVLRKKQAPSQDAYPAGPPQ